jgi:hypothetical protein
MLRKIILFFCCFSNFFSLVELAEMLLQVCGVPRGLVVVNLVVEDVLYMLDGMGIETGVSMEKLLEATDYISKELGRAPSSRAANALLIKKGYKAK